MLLHRYCKLHCISITHQNSKIIINTKLMHDTFLLLTILGGRGYNGAELIHL